MREELQLKTKTIQKNTLCPVAGKLSVLELQVGGQVAAGYPAEAYNYIEERIDLNKYILGISADEKYSGEEGRELYNGKNRKYIKCVWSSNRNMTGEGIDQGDLIVIDMNKKLHKDSIILYWLDDEFALKRCVKKKESTELISLLDDVKPIVLTDATLRKTGVVTHVIKKFPCHNNNYRDYPDNIENYLANGMDFNKYVIGNNWWETIFYLWAGGDSMAGDGITKGDLLVVDKLREHYDDSILVFYLDRQFTLKRIQKEGNITKLVSSNPDMKPIELKEETQVKKWGVLTTVIKRYK